MSLIQDNDRVFTQQKVLYKELRVKLYSDPSIMYTFNFIIILVSLYILYNLYRCS